MKASRTPAPQAQTRNVFESSFSPLCLFATFCACGALMWLTWWHGSPRRRPATGWRTLWQLFYEGVDLFLGVVKMRREAQPPQSVGDDDLMVRQPLAQLCR